MFIASKVVNITIVLPVVCGCVTLVTYNYKVIYGFLCDIILISVLYFLIFVSNLYNL